MKLNNSWRVKLTQILLGAGFLLALVAVRGIHAGNEPVPLATDWSHRHVVYSAPKNLGEYVRLLSSPRFVQQLVRRNVGNAGIADQFRWRRAPETPETLKGDWNVYLGNVGTVGAGNYPAKYSFNSSAANCGTATQPDFVVYNTSLAGSTTAVAAFDTATVAAEPALNATITITNGVNTLTMTATAGANSHTGAAGSGAGTFQRSAIVATQATNLFNAINIANNGSFAGVSATNPSAGVVIITATTAGSSGNSISVGGTAIGAGVTTAFTNFVDGASGVPTIVAMDNLYAGCSGTVPSTYWAYNTGTTDSVVTSPTFSGDGKQVAFMQSVGAGAASLVLLRWAANSGTLAAPVAPTSQTPTNYYNTGTGCTAPCMTTIAFADGDADTTSAPFYDFAPGSDTLWVGDATGKLHKFNPVFKGIPAEVTTGGYPFTMATAPLTSPVYDEGSGLVIASAAFSTSNNGGRVHTLCVTVAVPSCGTVGVTTVATGILGPSTAGFTCQSPGAGGTSGDTANLLFDSPIIDPINKTLYVVIGNDSTGHSALYEFPEAYTANSCGTEIQLGTGSTTGVAAYNGDFDNLYYCNGTSACTTGGAGHFYACANTGGNPTVYQVTVSAAGAISGTANASAALTTAATTCGPVEEFYNPNAGPATDWIFTSVQASAQTASPIFCPASSGCIMSFNVTAGSTLTTSTPTVGHATVAGGASGVALDNTVESSPSGASQVYFTPLATGNCTTSTGEGTGGCAIQASQSLLN